MLSRKMRVSMIAGLVSAISTACVAQSYSAPGASWSSTWSYGSATDRSVGLSTAQAIFAARATPTAPVTNVYNTTNSNTTSSVGSMNTGSTTVTVKGSNNSVTSSSGAETSGCVDGSLSTALLDNVEAFPLGPIDLSILGLEPEKKCD